MGSLFPRGNRLYAKTKTVEGKWKQLATGFSVGQEDEARAWLDDVERSVEAARSDEVADDPLGLTVRAFSATWIEERKALDLDWKNDRLRWPFPFAFAWFAINYAMFFPGLSSHWFDRLARAIAAMA